MLAPGDIRDAELLDRIFRQYDVQYVYHLAAYAAEGWGGFFQTNNRGLWELTHKFISEPYRDRDCFRWLGLCDCVLFFAVRSFSFHPLLQLSNQSRWISNLKKRWGACGIMQFHSKTYGYQALGKQAGSSAYIHRDHVFWDSGCSTYLNDNK